MMPPNERADLSAGPIATATSHSSTPRYVRMPLSIRREHRDWSNGEHAAWTDLLLASYEHRGRFESVDLIRALLGARASALDALIERGELVDEDGEWIFPFYFELYGEDGRLQRKTRDERLQDAADKMARGERLTDAEYAARHRARREGVPFPLPRPSDVRSDESDEPHTTTTTNTDDYHNDESVAVVIYESLYGKPPTAAKDRWLRNMEEIYGEKRVSLALREEHRRDGNPRTICGRMEAGLKRGNVLSLGATA